MNPTIDVERFLRVSNERSETIAHWCNNQLPQSPILYVEATTEGEVVIRTAARRAEILEQHCHCEPAKYWRPCYTVVGRRLRVPVTTPPPWTHPDWTDL